MKTFVVSLIILLATTQVFGQVFGKKKSKEDPQDTQITALTKQLDSVSKELVKYMGVYDTLRIKVFHYNFDPAKTAFLIDSVKLKPVDSALILRTNAYIDTIAVLKKENSAMKSSIALANSEEEKIKALAIQDELDKAKVVGILRSYKELLDTHVITEAEFSVLKKKYLEKL